MDIITIIVLTGLTNLTFALYSWQQVSNPESHFACKAFAEAQFIKGVSYLTYAISLNQDFDNLRLIANVLILIGCWAEVRAYVQLSGTQLRKGLLALGAITTCGVFTWLHLISGDGPNNIMIITMSLLLILPLGMNVYVLSRLMQQYPRSAYPRVLVLVNAVLTVFCMLRIPLAIDNPEFTIMSNFFVIQAFTFATFIHGLGNGIGFIGFLKERSDEKLRVRANYDYLTGIYNRQYFERISQERLQSDRDFTLYFLDLDKFKSVNDRFGHAAGDEILRRFGQLLRGKQERYGGVVGRLGGEEFGMLLPNDTDLSHPEIINNLLKSFAEVSENTIGEALTFSLGACDSATASSVQELMHHADELLYDAKYQLRGFTLIELIIVIVVLGLLAVTAAPSFLNFRTDANRALLEGFVGSSKSAVNLVYSKAVIQGEAEKVLGNVDLDDDGVSDIQTVYGYPTADRANGLSNALELGSDWAWGNTFGGAEIFFSPTQIVGFSGPTNNNIPLRSQNCYVGYRPPTAQGSAPEYTFYDSGC